MFWKKSNVATDEEKIEDVLSRGVVEVINRSHLKKKMLSGKRLIVKLGIDPTGPEIHVGHTIALLKLRDFQKLGHKAVLIIGDATGVVGDTSDKDSERPMLSRGAILQNKKTYIEQTAKILDAKRTKFLHNSEWLNTLKYDEIGKQADQFSVSDFTSRENIKRRLDAGKRVSLREVLYPLMQGYDSVAMHADVELGGTDQKFNLLAGRTLQRHYGQEPQDVLMMELLQGANGQKMSKAAGNTVGLLDSPENMYGKVMWVNDKLVEKYLVLTTRVLHGEIDTIVGGHPRDAKMRLARELVTMYHGDEAAVRAEKDFVGTFVEGGVPKNVREEKLVDNLRDTLVLSGIVSSKSEWQRLVEAGAVKNMDTGEVVKNPGEKVLRDTVFKVGKKKFLRIRI